MVLAISTEQAILLTQIEMPLSMTCADGTGIEKGVILKLSDPNTCATTTAAVDIVAGISAHEKIASDGRTNIGVYKKGRFKLKISGNVTAGDSLVTDSYANHVKSTVGLIEYDISRGRILGISQETGTTGEFVVVDVNVQAQS